jgi:cytochrome b involved in lipid metabolism
VYDVTAFMEEHPGGDEVLLACTGNPSSPSTSPHANEVVGGS